MNQVIPNKKIITTCALFFIVLMGLSLRLYHINYPVIGYHNWKEVATLSEARNFYKNGFFKYGPFIPAYSYPYATDDPSGAHSGTFPLMSIIGGLFMKIFGPKLWIARMTGVLIGIVSVVLIYFLLKEFFKKRSIAIVGAFITAITPLFVVFDGKFHVDTPCFSLALITIYFYSKWVKFDSRKYFISFVSVFVLLALTRYDSTVIAIPMILTFPYKRLFNTSELKKHTKEYLIGLFLLLLIPIWHLYNIFYVSNVWGNELEKQFSAVNPFLVFTTKWISTVIYYLITNFTLIGVLLSIFGLIFMVQRYFKHKDFVSKFILGYAISLIPFSFIMAGHLIGHNYHQFPIALLVIILITYCIFIVSNFIIKVLGFKKSFIVLFMAIFAALLYFPAQKDAAAMFDTQFYGLDVAGKYIKNHSSLDEFILHSGYQDFGVSWHADRYLYGIGLPKTVEEFKVSEKTRNARWIFVYWWGMDIMRDGDKRWDYIKNNYSLRQFAFSETSNEKGVINPIYYLFEKGGSYNEKNLDDVLKNSKEYLYKDYENTNGVVRMYYIEINK